MRAMKDQVLVQFRAYYPAMENMTQSSWKIVTFLFLDQFFILFGQLVMLHLEVPKLYLVL
jgi:hypothetical protein